MILDKSKDLSVNTTGENVNSVSIDLNVMEEIELTTDNCRNFLREKILKRLNNFIRVVQSGYHEDVVELNFIQSGSLLIDFYSWRNKKSQELAQALCSAHLDPEDLSMINSFLNGHISSNVFFPFHGLKNSHTHDTSSDTDDSDDDIDVRHFEF